MDGTAKADAAVVVLEDLVGVGGRNIMLPLFLLMVVGLAGPVAPIVVADGTVGGSKVSNMDVEVSIGAGMALGGAGAGAAAGGGMAAGAGAGVLAAGA